eukprot:Colp12_sorted_trinity150504_noHs@25835
MGWVHHKVREEVHKFALTTSLNGFPRMYDEGNSRLRTYLWALVFLAGCGAFGYVIYYDVDQYLSYPSTTSTDVVYARTLPFPALTICNNNMVKVSCINKFLNVTNITDPFDTSIMSSLSESQIRSCAHNLTDLLVKATFPNFDFNFTSDVADFYNPNYGVCYTINGNQRFTNYISGSSNGLTLLFNLQYNEYIPVTQSSGLVIVVHDPSTSPEPQYNGMLISPGEFTHVGLRRVETSLLGPPYGTCSSTATGENNTLYSVNKCYEECLNTEVKKTCNCRTTGTGLSFNTDGTQLADCSEAVKTKECMKKVKSQFSLGVLSCKCAPLCDSVTFQTTVSHHRWPGPTYSRLMEKYLNVSASVLDVSYGVVTVYFETMGVVTYTQSADYSLIDFFSDFGSFAGLFIGASCMTMCEALELLLLLALLLVARPSSVSVQQRRDSENPLPMGHLNNQRHTSTGNLRKAF